MAATSTFQTRYKIRDVIGIASAKLEHIIRWVWNGRRQHHRTASGFTSLEAGGDIYVVETDSYSAVRISK